MKTTRVSLLAAVLALTVATASVFRSLSQVHDGSLTTHGAGSNPVASDVLQPGTAGGLVTIDMPEVIPGDGLI